MTNKLVHLKEVREVKSTEFGKLDIQRGGITQPRQTQSTASNRVKPRLLLIDTYDASQIMAERTNMVVDRFRVIFWTALS